MSGPLTWVGNGCNLLWAVDSLLLLVTGWVAPTTLGYAVVVGQALAVAVFAGLQYVGLRRAAPTLVRRAAR